MATSKREYNDAFKFVTFTIDADVTIPAHGMNAKVVINTHNTGYFILGAEIVNYSTPNLHYLIPYANKWYNDNRIGFYNMSDSDITLTEGVQVKLLLVKNFETI